MRLAPVAFHAFMASVFLTSSLDTSKGSLQRLMELAALDKVGEHRLTDDPKPADLVLFAESAWGNELLWKARRHPLVRRYRDKCFVQCELDGMAPYLPGVYTSVPRRWYRPDRVRTGPYLWMYQNPAVAYEPSDVPEWLFSFVGDAATHPVRRAVLALDHPRSRLEDAGGYRSVQGAEPNARGRYQRAYAETLRASAFVLCPRGVSPSSVRVFETMRSGRVPVIVSDEWVAPVGPDWPSFSVLVPEAEVASLPARLEALEPEAAAMGHQARQAWETWFADDVAFHHTVEACLDIMRTRTQPERRLRWTAYRAFAETHYVANVARRVRNGVRERLRSR